MLPFCGSSEEITAKKWLNKEIARGSWESREEKKEANKHFDPTKTKSGPHHHIETAVDWCSSFLVGNVVEWAGMPTTATMIGSSNFTITTLLLCIWEGYW